MKRTFGAIAVLAVGLFTAVSANQDLLTLQKDDNQWAIPARTTRRPATARSSRSPRRTSASSSQVWSFSTGALRGHEGQPLVVGSTMYVHSAYPNHIYALDMTKEGWPIKWKYTPVQNDRAVPVACCDLVHRGVNYAQGKIYMTTLDGQVIALDANTGKEVVEGPQRRSDAAAKRRPMAGLVVKDKYIVGVSGGEFGIRGWVAAYALADGKQVWKAYSMGPDEDIKLAPDFNRPILTTGDSARAPRPGRASVEERRRQHMGLVLRTTPTLNLLYYSTGNPGTWNPIRAPGRQQVVDDHLRPRSRHGDGEVGLPDDAVGRVGLRRHQRAHAARPEHRRQADEGARRISIGTASPTCSIARTARCSRPRSSCRHQLGGAASI